MNNKEIKYRIDAPSDVGEQYLAIIDTDIYYYGKVRDIKLVESKNTSFIYFVSKAINNGSDRNGIDNLSFYDFQHSEKPIGIMDWDSTKFDKKGVLFSIDIYNAMWGELKGDTLVLNATKHLYYSRFDKIRFVKIKDD